MAEQDYYFARNAVPNFGKMYFLKVAQEAESGWRLTPFRRLAEVLLTSADSGSGLHTQFPRLIDEGMWLSIGRLRPARIGP